jgi:hypothetical protein
MFSKVFVDELDGGGAFADGRGDAFDRAVADVAGGEDAGQAGLQQQRWSVQGPALGWPAVAEQVAAGEQETPLVPVDGAGQPAGVGLAR